MTGIKVDGPPPDERTSLLPKHPKGGARKAWESVFGEGADSSGKSRRVLSPLPAPSWSGPGPSEMVDKAVSLISQQRKEALQVICGDQRIRTLYHRLYSEDLPTQEQFSRFSDREAASLVQKLERAAGPFSLRPKDIRQNLRALICQKYLAELDGAAAKLDALRAITSDEMLPAYRALQDETHSLCEGLSKNPAGGRQPLGAVSKRMKGLRSRLSDFYGEIASHEEGVKALQQKLGLPSTEAARTVYYGLRSNWKKGFVEFDAKTGLMRQIHNIKGLKVYPLPGTRTLVADYAGKVIGRGAYKRVKAAVRIGDPEGRVRLTSLAKEMKLPPNATPKESEVFQGKIEEEVGFFTDDAEEEMSARKLLSENGVPHIAEIEEVNYFGKSGPKRRLIMKQYAADLQRFAAKDENREKAVQCCVDVAESLTAMHKAGLVHADIKPANVLTDGQRGYLSDFGLMKKARKRFTLSGNLAYMSPESFSTNLTAIVPRRICFLLDFSSYMPSTRGGPVNGMPMSRIFVRRKREMSMPKAIERCTKGCFGSLRSAPWIGLKVSGILSFPGFWILVRNKGRLPRKPWPN